jgi:DNA-binding response OmpR family regulator
LNNPQNLLPDRSDQTVVLIAEDEVTIQNVARIVLEKDGYFVLTASDGAEAMTISREYPGTIHALLTDVKMPRVDGLELAKEVRQMRPSIKILIMSGQIEDPLVRGAAFLRKPFGPSLLRERMRLLLAETSGQ